MNTVCESISKCYDAWMNAMQWKYMPMFLVFLSGLGFSLQTLTVKKLEQEYNFGSTFQLIFFRGLIQAIIAYIFFRNFKTVEDKEMFGNTNYIKKILFARSFFGFGGICFSFLAVELLPIGDSTVLVMMSPMFATIFSYFVLDEPWRFVEFSAAVISIVGVIFVAKPSSIFGGAALNPVGVAYGLIASVSAGCAYTLVRLLGTSAKMPWWNVCFAQSLGQMVPSLLCMYLLGQLTIPTPFVLFVIIATGFLGSWSQIAMTVGMQREKSALATGMRMSDVFFGFLWQVMFTNDSDVSWLSILGAFLVVTSIFVLIFGKRTSPPETTISSSSGKKNIGNTIELHKRSTNDGETYNVLNAEESEHGVPSKTDTGCNDTAIDISDHPHADYDYIDPLNLNFDSADADAETKDCHGNENHREGGSSATVRKRSGSASGKSLSTNTDDSSSDNDLNPFSLSGGGGGGGGFGIMKMGPRLRQGSIDSSCANASNHCNSSATGQGEQGGMDIRSIKEKLRNALL